MAPGAVEMAAHLDRAAPQGQSRPARAQSQEGQAAAGRCRPQKAGQPPPDQPRQNRQARQPLAADWLARARRQ
jgi:hypothetical protein